MSLCTVVELALQFESFRNVDLFHQGLYHLKTRLYRDDEGRALAFPYSYLKGPSMAMEPPKGKPRVDHHNLIPAHVNEEMYTFSTRSFLIRYCEEEVELGDVGQFRLELSPSELERRNPLLLEVELMFADLTQHPSEPLGDQPDVESAEFRCVSTQVLRLRGVERGLHDFCPVVFDECHFCLLNLAVHSAVVDLRFRVRPALRKMAATKPKVAGPAPRAGAKESEAQDLCSLL
ncbi:FAM135A [Symbiodinium sp. CCMP2456]|nr:FAM135A [Symbiodinium sp. CCMP2456]